MNRPGLAAADVRKVGAHFGIVGTYLVGVRGYFEKSMGNPTKNDRGIYDDAIFLVTPSKVRAYNGNTDPSFGRKGMANLKPGVWEFETGLHGLSRPNPYPAFRQHSKMTVYRDDVGDDSGYFGINLHRGGINSTSSLGCQTIVASQWDEFIGEAYEDMGTTVADVRSGVKGARGRVIKYILVTRAELEKIIGHGI